LDGAQPIGLPDGDRVPVILTGNVSTRVAIVLSGPARLSIRLGFARRVLWAPRQLAPFRNSSKGRVLLRAAKRAGRAMCGPRIPSPPIGVDGGRDSTCRFTGPRPCSSSLRLRIISERG